ncbi:MAG: hypothetical protein JO348_12245 [Alphaproteobacteria bacterium]|nr:hypothetical protein [Alphaproteobacteria bacterium]MBV9420535.1 hypothetical protein [Alphaproteobacteria bacterium]
MTLNDLASLGSFVSGVAVLVSLVFLYFQLRQVTQQIQQAERNQQAGIRQGRTNRLVDIVLAGADPSLANAAHKAMAGDDSLTETELYQFRSYARAQFYHAEDSFYQHQNGLLTEEAFDTFIASWRGLMAMPGFRVQWRRNRASFQGDFRSYMDKLLATTSPIAGGNDLEAWKAETRAEKAAAQTAQK